MKRKEVVKRFQEHEEEEEVRTIMRNEEGRECICLKSENEENVKRKISIFSCLLQKKPPF